MVIRQKHRNLIINWGANSTIKWDSEITEQRNVRLIKKPHMMICIVTNGHSNILQKQLLNRPHHNNNARHPETRPAYIQHKSTKRTDT